jgi:hypothetical protein
MRNTKVRFHSPNSAGSIAIALFALVVAGFALPVAGQDTPLLSGGVGFFHNTKGGHNDFQLHAEPLIAAPIGDRVLFESRSILLEDFSAKTGGQSGFNHSHFINVIYMQGDIHAAPHLNLVVGDFILPFNTYNDRLSEIWITNFQDGPLIWSLGTLGSGSGVGGMISGSVLSNEHHNFTYNAWYSARSGNEQFSATRAFGGRATTYLPDARLEIGLSYDRQLQGVHENFYGAHVWWEPKDTAFRLRSEYGRGHHAHGYWVEADYRTQAFGGLDSWVGRFQPVFRMQQTFRRDNTFSDGLPSVNTQRVDFGLNYNLPHNTRIMTSYSRQFSSKNTNIWETGIVYRFLFPTWKVK